MELDLSLNFLSSVPVGALGQLRNLKFLNLGSNRIQVWQFLLTTYYFSFPPTKEMMRKCCFMVFKWKNSNLKWLLRTIFKKYINALFLRYSHFNWKRHSYIRSNAVKIVPKTISTFWKLFSNREAYLQFPSQLKHVSKMWSTKTIYAFYTNDNNYAIYIICMSRIRQAN